MALVSPGIQISINNQSQYVNSNVGSVPLVVLATAQDKTYNGAAATGTSKANAGKLQSFTSQRDLITALGTPTFQVSAASTPINGSEINEYGLLTAYSALGSTNQLFAIRADVDLDQLKGTSVRPTGVEANGKNWLDLANTDFGLYSLNATTSSFTKISPLLITSAAQVFDDSNFGYSVPTPLASVGQQGSYALVFVDTDGTVPSTIRLFYKTTTTSVSTGNGGPGANAWVQVGSTNWQNAVPVLQGTASNPTLSGSGTTLTINSVTVNSSATSVTTLATDINSASIPGVKAVVTPSGLLTLFATSAAKSDGSVVDGKISIVDGTHSPLYKAGLVTASVSGTKTAYCPYFFYGNYAQAPAGGWFASDSQPRPTGSVWWKTTSTGAGWNPSLKQYNASLDTWVSKSVPAFNSLGAAINALDPIGGGKNIAGGQLIASVYVNDTTSNNLTLYSSTGGATTVGTSSTPTSFTSGDEFTISASQPGVSAFSSPVTITLSGTTAASFVSDILNANIPYVTAQLNSTGTITISHTAGGVIVLVPVDSGVLSNAGFDSSSSEAVHIGGDGSINIMNWDVITTDVAFSTTTPYTNPQNGTLWYYSNPADVDVMINDNGWKGYRTVASDVRGYNLQNTDPNGVIVSPSAPSSKSTGNSLSAGDLWLDSSDLINYPKLYRYNGTAFIAIDNTDHVTNNGIVFADARWDTDGTMNPISDTLPSVAELAGSDYIDQDAPDYRLYPRGALLFNTRRSGFNVKRFVVNYFNSTSFPTLPAVPNAGSVLPTVKDAWVSASGLNELGVMNAGSAAQRDIVVSAMQAAVNSNTDVLDENFNFNLIVAPGYPELIPSLVTLNDNRGSTAFVIGDTPMTLAPVATELANWSNNTGTWAGKGLATASAYLGVYYPAGLTSDLAGNTVAVPASHAALRTFLHNDNVSYPWFAPAGVNRGLVSNLSDVGYVNAQTGAFVHNGINQGLRDSLYTLNINPIVQLPGTGLVVWGQETRSGDTSARNRVNVVRLENYLRVIFKSVSNGYLFEPNDTVTRKSIATQIESALSDILSKRGLYDFLVICDTNNNTSHTIANNQLIVDVAIEPMKDVEFIYIPIAIYNPGTIATLNAGSK